MYVRVCRIPTYRVYRLCDDNQSYNHIQYLYLSSINEYAINHVLCCALVPTCTITINNTSSSSLSYFPLVSLPCVIRRWTALCAELLPDCVRFSCCSRGPDCGIRFNCCSPFASASSCCSPIAPASAAARRLRPLQLLLPIASASAATPARLYPNTWRLERIASESTVGSLSNSAAHNLNNAIFDVLFTRT